MRCPLVQAVGIWVAPFLEYGIDLIFICLNSVYFF